MTLPPAKAPGPRLPLAALSARLQAELDLLAGHSAEIQRALPLCHLDLAGTIDAAAIRGLQRIDRITQTLEDLARLMAALAAALPPDLGVDAGLVLGRVRLQELADALNPQRPPGPHPAPPSGEVQWL